MPGSHRPPSNLSEVKPQHITTLARLLSLHPSLHPTDTSWLQDQSTQLRHLAAPLLRPSALLLRIAMHLPSSLHQATLCKTHKALNPFLTHSIFRAVVAECTTRLTYLVSSSTFTIPAHIQMFVRRVQSLNSLWMGPEAYRAAFQMQANEKRHERVVSDCEACILARVGGDEQMVCDLRAMLVGRRKKGAQEPELRGLVEAWIQGLHGGEARRQEIMKVSDTLGREVRRVRREMQCLRRLRKGKMRGGFEKDGPGSDQGTEKQGTPKENTGKSKTNKENHKPSLLSPKKSRRSWTTSDSTLLPPVLSPSARTPTNSERINIMKPMHGEDSPLSIPQDEQQYFDESIIDYYASLSSTVTATADRTSMHPAFTRQEAEPGYSSSSNKAKHKHKHQRKNKHKQPQNPFLAPDDTDTETDPETETGTSPPPQAAATARPTRQPTYKPPYTASIYSHSSSSTEDAQISGLLSHNRDPNYNRNAEEQARAYRALVGVSVDEGEEDGFVGKGEEVRGRTTAVGRGRETGRETVRGGNVGGDRDVGRKGKENAGVGVNVGVGIGVSIGLNRNSRASSLASRSTQWTDLYDSNWDA